MLDVALCFCYCCLVLLLLLPRASVTVALCFCYCCLVLSLPRAFENDDSHYRPSYSCEGESEAVSDMSHDSDAL